MQPIDVPLAYRAICDELPWPAGQGYRKGAPMGTRCRGAGLVPVAEQGETVMAAVMTPRVGLPGTRDALARRDMPSATRHGRPFKKTR